MWNWLFFYHCWLGKHIFTCPKTKLVLTSCRCISVNHVLEPDIHTLCKCKWEVVNLHDDAAKGVNLGSTGEMNGTSCWSVINHLWLTHSAGRAQFCCTRARVLKVHDNGLPKPRWALFWERSKALLLYSTETDTGTHTHTRTFFSLAFSSNFNLTWLLRSQQCSIVVPVRWVPESPIYLNL